jgi:hypothetical protein
VVSGKRGEVSTRALVETDLLTYNSGRWRPRTDVLHPGLIEKGICQVALGALQSGEVGFNLRRVGDDMSIGPVLGRAFVVEESSPIWLRALLEALDQPDDETPEAEHGRFLAQHIAGAAQGKST